MSDIVKGYRVEGDVVDKVPIRQTTIRVVLDRAELPSVGDFARVTRVIFATGEVTLLLESVVR